MNTPQVGQTISVVVPNDTPALPSLFPNQPETRTLTGTVLPSYNWLSPDQFCLSSTDDFHPIRVITMRRVLSIDGAKIEQTINAPRIVTIKGSKGDLHIVTLHSSRNECSCLGFSYRKHCSHIDQALGYKKVVTPVVTKSKKVKRDVKATNAMSKIQRCRQLFDKKLSRQENLDVFTATVGMSRACASTYYQQIRSK